MGSGNRTPEMDGAHRAGGDAVQATDATGVVDVMMVDIDASRVAGFDATSAFNAFFRDRQFEQADSGDDAKRCSDGAEGVAEEAFAPNRGTDDDDDRQDGANSV